MTDGTENDVRPESETRDDVKQTIAEIKNERIAADHGKRSAKSVALTVFAVIFFPVTALIIGTRKLFNRLRVGITAKTTVVFTVVFGLMLIGYAAFVLASIAQLADSGGELTDAYMSRLIITSCVLVFVFIVLGAVLGGFSSQYMMEPVRKITRRVKDISDENDLSARLDPVDSQDEFMALTEQINNMLESLEQAFERQENFVSDASHELKTPLAVIAGYANLLRRWGKDDPKVLDEAVEAISRESGNMKRIVDQLLWLAKLGDFTLDNSEFNLYEAVSDLADGYKMIDTGHSINFVGDPSVEVVADKNLLTEAIRTLVDNAIKYTPSESGVIGISLEKTEDGGVAISVSDNGIGISDADKTRIFERFYRCDKVRGRASGSCGLGLTICKQIVEMMGGKIDVQSQLGKGSTFTVLLAGKADDK